MISEIKLNGEIYAIARDEKGTLQYNHRSGPVERGTGLWEHVAFGDGVGGMGYSAEAPGVPDNGFYYSQNCLTVLPRSLSPGPTVKVIETTMTKNIRGFFEEKDQDGQYYLYAHGIGEVAKIKLAYTPTLVSIESVWAETEDVFQADTFQVDAFGSVTSSLFQSTDVFGQAVRARVVEQAFQEDTFQEGAFSTYSSGQWILPPDSGDRIVGLTRVEKAPSPDTWVVHTDVIDGASHFVIAAQNFWRTIASGRGKKISACDVLSDPSKNSSWGGKFPFGEQGAAATALIALHRFVFVVTQANIFGVTEDFNASAYGGSVSLSEMLPDIGFSDEMVDDAPVTGLGAGVWDASIMVPLPFALYRHDVSSYDRIGPDAFPHNSGEEPNLPNQIRFGRHRGVAAAGQWLYEIYEAQGLEGGFHIMASRKRGEGDGGGEPVVLQPIVYRPNGKALVLYVEKNGANAPRLWWARELEWSELCDQGGRELDGAIDFEYIDLGLDGGPFKPTGNLLNKGSYGDVSSSGAWYGKEFDLDAPGTLKSLREVEVMLDDGSAELSWQNQVSLDGGVVESVGTAFTTTGGTTFFVAQKKTRRIRPIAVWIASKSHVAWGNRTRVRKIVYRGAWLPNVADTITAMVDVRATAQRRGVSGAEVRSVLSALVLSDNYSFTDIHEADPVQVVVNEAEAREGVGVAGLEGKEMIHVSLSVHELS